MYSNVGVLAHQDFQKTKKKDGREGQKDAEENGRERKQKEPVSLSTRVLNFIRRRITPIVGMIRPHRFHGKPTLLNMRMGTSSSFHVRFGSAHSYIGIARTTFLVEHLINEEEADDFNIHVARHRPEELAKLIKTTKFTRKEIQLIYRGFKQECPTGMVDEESFKHIFAQFFPQGDATHYAHYVFNTMKHNQTGKISFEDFLDILSRVSRGTIQEKLQWIFGLYDLNGDGLITKSEMLDVVTSIYEMLGRHTEPQVEENSAKDHVEKLFHQIDSNKDGVVTIDELVEWCSRDERILQSLDTLDTVL